MDVEALVPQRPVERLNMRIIRGLSGTAEVDPDTMVVRPQVDQVTGELRAIIRKQVLGCAALIREAVENLDHVFAAQALAHLDRQRLAAEHVDHRQHAELLAVAQLVMDEVQTPRFVGTLWLAPDLAVHHHLASPRLLGAQRETLFTIQTVDDIATHLPAFALEQDMDPPITIADPRRDDLVHALAQFEPWIARTWLALGRTMLPRHLTGPALAVAVRRHDIGYNILHERWPGN